MHALASLLLLAAGHADAPPPALPGGFSDASGKIGVFTTPAGGVQTIDLATGKVRFQTRQVQRPVFLAGERLVALAAVQAPVVRGFCFKWQPPWDGPRNGFQIVVFDLANPGQIAQASETIPLPEWASIVDAHDRSFTCRAYMDNGRLILNWEAHTWYAGPTRLTPDEEAAHRHQATGAVRFAPETAGLEQLPPQAAPTAAPPFEAWRELERLSIRWHKRTANRLFVVTLEETRGGQTLSLRTYDAATRQLLSNKALKSGERLTVLPTLDEQHLCIRGAAPSPDLTSGDGGNLVQWTIVAAETGAAIAQVPYEPGTTAAAIFDGRSYFLLAGRINGTINQPFVVPRAVRAVDLKTGKTLWERPIGGRPAAPPPKGVTVRSDKG